MSLIQVRIDDKLKEQACKIYEKLGLDLSGAIRMFIIRTILENGVPFPMKLEREQTDASDAIEAMRECQKISKENGNSEMTLEEINEIIREVRRENMKGK